MGVIEWLTSYQERRRRKAAERERLAIRLAEIQHGQLEAIEDLAAPPGVTWQAITRP